MLNSAELDFAKFPNKPVAYFGGLTHLQSMIGLHLLAILPSFSLIGSGWQVFAWGDSTQLKWYLQLQGWANRKEGRNIRIYYPKWSLTSDFAFLSTDHQFQSNLPLLGKLRPYELLQSTFGVPILRQLRPTILKCFLLWLRAQLRPPNWVNTFWEPIRWLHLNIRPCRGTF